MKHITIWKEIDTYCSFPHISYLPNGNLAVVFRQASIFSSDVAKKGIATHHDPDSSIEIIESNDDALRNHSVSDTMYFYYCVLLIGMHVLGIMFTWIARPIIAALDSLLKLYFYG